MSAKKGMAVNNSLIAKGLMLSSIWLALFIGGLIHYLGLRLVYRSPSKWGEVLMVAAVAGLGVIVARLVHFVFSDYPITSGRGGSTSSSTSMVGDA
jgi:hypothetical protein